ncbi:acetyl-CoA carboxylase biotin carboxyl carrier protein subunit [Aurantibacillus circumpalustris]|uniref:acetyl-CoA carboxylase biotin carboxyl carrier protein subunit n=1 Tax=Aurantibacillus circumpalustris TaxID=3036359 RepID=UPI00295BC581|nr:acetyl-CoA carboxylase biotin carboxyl carrier protein subunit [Aurantibacillus circumpalustris]
MYSVTVNGKKVLKTDLKHNDSHFDGKLDEALINGDILKISPYQYHILYNNKSYTVDVVKINAEEKSLVLKVNSVKYNLQLKDKYDELLHSLGLDNLATKKVNDIKAPMPGMVLKILVNEGDEVKKGDALLVLEAMKMENILKSPTDGTIKKIAAIKGIAVEKNQLLIQF